MGSAQTMCRVARGGSPEAGGCGQWLCPAWSEAGCWQAWRGGSRVGKPPASPGACELLPALGPPPAPFASSHTTRLSPAPSRASPLPKAADASACRAPASPRSTAGPIGVGMGDRRGGNILFSPLQLLTGPRQEGRRALGTAALLPVPLCLPALQPITVLRGKKHVLIQVTCRAPRSPVAVVCSGALLLCLAAANLGSGPGGGIQCHVLGSGAVQPPLVQPLLPLCWGTAGFGHQQQLRAPSASG